MYFKRIEMHGFKSFADPAIIEFDKGITCVVGPNGSGKSNISDAIRWVLGEQSAKTLRGGKMEDVIFAGTTGRKSRGMAEVTLVIDNSQALLPIDYNEVAVTRRMYRSGESEYAINNSPCRMKDIRELFMDTGIGVDGYSLIGQGKISDIVSNKSDSIREIFEETAGVVMYRSKKAQTESKLKSTSINLDRVNDIIGEIEGRIDGLKEDSEKAKEFVKLRERYKELEINITLKNMEALQNRNSIFKDDIAMFESDIDEKKKKKNKLDEEKNLLAKVTEELERQGEEAKEKMLEAIKNINELESENEVNKERLQAREKDKCRLQKEIGEIDVNLARESENSIKENNSITEVDEKLRALKSCLEKENKDYLELQNANQKVNKEVEERKGRIFDIQKEISSRNNEKAGLVSLCETLEKRKIQILDELETGGNNLKSTETLLKDLEEGLTVELAKLKKLETENTEFSKGIQKSQELEKELISQLEKARIKDGQLSSRKKTIEEMESNYEGYFAAVKYIMQDKRQGIEGVVAELIDVPVGFEIALETALGGSLQNIICQTDEDAKRAIRDLKQNKAGRLTFLPIGSINPKKREKKDLTSEKGFSGYAVDVVDFNPKYRNVMEHLLGNVVVTEDMDSAIAMAKKEAYIKYVTLEGEVISSGGAITGGKFKNKSANILERRAEVVKLNDELDAVSKQKKLCESKLEETRAALENMIIDSMKIKDNLRVLELDVFEKEKEISIFKNSLSDYNNVKEKWDRELLEIEKEQENSTRDISRIESESKDFLEEFKSNEGEIEKLLSKSDLYKSDIEKNSEEITKIRIELSQKESEKNKIISIIDIVQNSILNLEKNKKEKEKEIAEIDLFKEKNLTSSEGSKDNINKFKAEKEKLENEMQKTASEKSEKMSAFTETIKIRDELDFELEKLQNQKHELSLRLAKQETQLENLNNKLWEEFEVSYAGALDYKRDDFVMSTSTKENKEIKDRMRALGDVNVGAIEEYEKVSEKYAFLTEQRDDIVRSSDELKAIIKDMDKIITSRFKESFDKITVNFEETFKELFGGGTATINIDNEDNPLEATIEINAQPPGKQLKHINLLSGGEKSMTAIALMFAVLKTKPTPCCVLDEVEAALDDSNIDIFAKYLRKFESVQFTLITHQKATMEHADAMYGITMPEKGISKIYSLKMEDEIA